MAKKFLVILGVLLALLMGVTICVMTSGTEYYSYCGGPINCGEFPPESCGGTSIENPHRIPDGPDRICYGNLIEQNAATSTEKQATKSDKSTPGIDWVDPETKDLVSIDVSSLHSSSHNPTLSGSANGFGFLNIGIIPKDRSGTASFNKKPIPVVNGHWSIQLSPQNFDSAPSGSSFGTDGMLQNGTYDVQIMPGPMTVPTSVINATLTVKAQNMLSFDQAVEAVYNFPAIKNWKPTDGESSLWCGDLINKQDATYFYVSCTVLQPDGHHTTIGLYAVNMFTGEVKSGTP